MVEARRCPSPWATITPSATCSARYQPEAIRYLLASAPYRKSLNFTFDGLKSSAIAIDRLRNFKLRLETDQYAEGVNDPLMAAPRRLPRHLPTASTTTSIPRSPGRRLRVRARHQQRHGFRRVPRGNAAAALQFLAASIPYSMCSPPRSRAARSPMRNRPPYRRAHRRQESPELSRSPTRFATSSAQGIILEDTKSGVRWKRKSN